MNNYDSVSIITATQWEPKTSIWADNLKEIESFLGVKVSYYNLNFEQRTLMGNFDSLKDSFYSHINFDNRFDIVTHDSEDCHTDHIACNMIANGLFKYTTKFVTIYSPSSKNFKANQDFKWKVCVFRSMLSEVRNQIYDTIATNLMSVVLEE